MENKRNLKAIDILKESLKVFAKNTNFIFFTALTSLPLFLFSLYFQTLFQAFLLQASQTLQEQAESALYPHRTFVDLAEVRNVTAVSTRRLFLTLDHATVIPYSPGWLRPLSILGHLTRSQSRELLYLGFVYLAPTNLSWLVAVVPTVDLASKLYREEEEHKALTFKDVLLTGKRLGGEKLRGTLVTFVYIVAFSSSTLVGFVWLLLTYRAVLSYFPSDYHWFGYTAPLRGDICFHALYGFNLVLLSGMYLGWGVIWNLSIVVSVLEGRYGTRAFGSSGYLCLRNLQNGVVLMLVFSIWEVGLRVPWWFDLGGYKAWLVIVAQTGLFCLGNAVKWVGFVVYFDSCVKRLFVKKVVDVEQG